MISKSTAERAHGIIRGKKGVGGLELRRSNCRQGNRSNPRTFATWTGTNSIRTDFEVSWWQSVCGRRGPAKKARRVLRRRCSSMDPRQWWRLWPPARTPRLRSMPSLTGAQAGHRENDEIHLRSTRVPPDAGLPRDGLLRPHDPLALSALGLAADRRLEQMTRAYESGWAGGIMKTAFDNVPIHIPAEYMFTFGPSTYANCRQRLRTSAGSRVRES